MSRLDSPSNGGIYELVCFQLNPLAKVKLRRLEKPRRLEMAIEAQTYRAVQAVAPGKLELRKSR
jgi:hypothetical protein